MKLTWLGTASILLEGEGGKLLFDPYLKRHSHGLPPFPLEEIGDVDAILITHPHLDHFADMPEIMAHCPAPGYVCARGLELAREQGFPTKALRQIAAEDELRIGELRIRAYQSCHCVFDRPLVRKTLSRALRPSHLREGLSIENENLHFRIDPERDVLAYEIREGAQSVFLLGSANFRPDVEYPRGMELLVYPYQGRSDMDVYSLQFLEKFQPKRVLLDHFDDAFPPVSAKMDWSRFLELARERFPEIEIIVPREGVPVDLGGR